MAPPGTSPPRFRRPLRYTLGVLSLALLSGCANGDFGRIKPSLVSDDMHTWIGTEATGSVGAPTSHLGLTDDERELRDLAYPLIEPPFDRQRWHSILGEYGATRVFRAGVTQHDQTAYSRELMSKPYRSPTGRYARLIEDIRNDTVRIGPFFRIAARVADMDRKRQQSLAYVSNLDEEERVNALARIAENRLVIDWIHRSLNERAAGYRYALERLVIAYPSPMAVDAERALNQLQRQIGQTQVAALAELATYRPRPAKAGLKPPLKPPAAK